LQPFDPIRIEFIKHDGIEAAIAIGIGASCAGQPDTSRQNDAPLLGRRDTAGRTTEASVLAQAHLSENYYIGMLGNQVDFASLVAHIAGENACAIFFEVTRGQSLCLGSVGIDF